MTTPNYPYGDPKNNGNGDNDAGYEAYGSPESNGAGADYPVDGGYPTEPVGAGQMSNSYPPAAQGAHGQSYQDPYANGYTGGFENSPMNNTTTNKVAAWALGLGIAAIVALLAIFTGIGVVLTFFAPVIAIAGIIVSIIALVKGRKIQGPGKRTAFSVIGLILSLLTLVIIAAFAFFIAAILGTSGIMDCFAPEFADTAAQQACVEDAMNNF